MDPTLYKTQAEIDAIPITTVRTYADQPDIDPITLLMEIVTTATDGVGGGGGLPNGGVAGQLLIKQSPADGDALWDDLVLDGGNASG